MRKKRSRLWFHLHSWLGLKLSLVMSFVLITGTLAVVSNELDWLANASMRVEPRPAAERASWGEIYASLRARYPEWQFTYMRKPIDPWFTTLVYGQTPASRTRLIDINPYTAEVQGERPWMSFQRFFRNTHRHLMLPVQYGVPLVSALAIVLMASLVTGLVVYKKFWRGFFKRPRRERGARIFNGDLHRLMGLWTLWFLPLIALTSLFYLAESLGWRAPPFGDPGKPLEEESQLTGSDMDRYARRAREALPGLRIAMVLPPAGPGDDLIFRGHTDGTWLVRPRASYVAIDPSNGEVLGSHRSRNANWHQRISEMADPLHFGTFGGLPTKLIWFVFGALLSGLSVTGCVTYVKRLQRPRQTEPGNSWKVLWQAMGQWRWLGVLALLAVLVLTPLEALSRT